MASLELLPLLPPEQQEFILNGPALEPPTGVRPNFVDPPNGNMLFTTVLSIGLAISTLATFLRLYTKALVIRTLQIEDGLLFVGYTLFVAFSYCCYDLMINGTGFFVHQWHVQVKSTPNISYLVHIASSFYAVTMGCLKVAILLEWIRIFAPKGSRGWFFYSCWALLVVNALFYTAGTIAGNLSCIPHKKIWDQTVPGHCINRKALDTATAAINIMSGLFILALPHGVIWNLNLNTAKKIGISSIFAIGLFAVISAICRLAATIEYMNSPDATYYISGTALWCVAEQTCAILVFCVPVLPKAFKDSKIFRNLLTLVRSTVRSSKGPSKNSDDAGWSASGQQDSYHMLEGDGGKLRSLKQARVAQGNFGSTEHLQAPADGIVRTNEVRMTRSDQHSVPSQERGGAAVPGWEGGR